MYVALQVRESLCEDFTGKDDNGSSTISNFFVLLTEGPARLMATPLKKLNLPTAQISESPKPPEPEAAVAANRVGEIGRAHV